MPATLDLSGQTFDRLFVVGFSHRRGRKRIHKCECLCGKTTFVETGALRTGHVKSCGCLHREQTTIRLQERNRTHGMSNTRIYKIWFGMLRRCKKPKDENYRRYGGRGIVVCQRWQSFENFFKDMGHPTPGLSLERLDTNGNYEPSNCMWADKYRQANNRSNNHRIEYKGKTYTLKQASIKFGVKYSKLQLRIRRGWDVERAIEFDSKV